MKGQFKIGTHPISLVHLSIITPKASTIWLKNSTDPIGFPLKVTELLT